MTPSPVILCDDLIAEILSFLRVKSLVRFRCVCKSWKTLISDSTFVKLHLKRSSTLYPQFTLITEHTTYTSDGVEFDLSVIPCPIRRLIDNPSFTLSVDSYYMLKDKGCLNVVGSCNGLICLAGHSGNSFTGEYRGYWFCIWNPATRTISEKFGYFSDFEIWPPEQSFKYPPNYNFKFGCDNSTATYKVVASCYDPHQERSNVRILSLGDNVWRDIESFPVVPLHLDNAGVQSYPCVGVYVSDTLNWLAIHNVFKYDVFEYDNIEDITVDQFVIVSLDLGTETYDQYMLPCGFDEVPTIEPTIGVCGGCLCFSYSYKKTYFVMWQMKKFGVEESWTQFLKISYLQLDYVISDDFLEDFQLVPWLLSEDSDTLILESSKEFDAILYNWRYDRVQRTRVTVTRAITKNKTRDSIHWFMARDFVESLVSIC